MVLANRNLILNCPCGSFIYVCLKILIHCWHFRLKQTSNQFGKHRTPTPLHLAVSAKVGLIHLVGGFNSEEYEFVAWDYCSKLNANS